MTHSTPVVGRPALSLVALNTTLLSFPTALVVAWLSGLRQFASFDAFLAFTIGFAVWSAPMICSLVLLTGGMTCMTRGRQVNRSVALLLGLLHGFLWSWGLWSLFAPILAGYRISFALPWMMSSLCGVLTVPAVCPPIQGRLVQHLHGDSLSLLVFFGIFAVFSSCGLVLMLSLGDGATQQRVVSPDQRITALVIRDDCGATCGCEMRVDLKSQTDYRREVYRSYSACDATIVWQNPSELDIWDDDGRHQHVNVQALGL